MRHVARSVPIAQAGAGLRDPPDARDASGVAVRDAARQALRALRRQPARGAGARARRARSTRSRAARRSSRSTTSAPSRCRRCATALLLNFEGEAEQVNTDTIVDELLAACTPTRSRARRRGAPLRRRLPQEAGVPARRLEARVRRAEPRRSAGAASAAAGSSSPTIGSTRPATTSGTSTGRPTSGWTGCCSGCSTKSRTCRSTCSSTRAGRWREPAKFDQARRIAAALCYIGLAHLDRVTILPFAATLGDETSPGRGKGRIFRVFELLERLEAGGPTDLRESFKEFASRAAAAGPGGRHLRLPRSRRASSRA